MRLNRLDLTRYGKFTDQVIDFDRAAAEKPDLHIIYGPNEAGKSTLFNAWLDLLFGIEAKSSYNFLHAYNMMRIGASVEINGERKDYVRIKRQQNSLLDGSDQPVPEMSLMTALGGLDRDSYRTMFSLDDDTLEKGGESILASRGDLGELLFQASAGLAEFGQKLSAIRAETEVFYKYRARSGELADLKAQLATLKSERDALDIQASEHARLTKALKDAAERYEAASEERKQHRIRRAEINHLLAALPRLSELNQLSARIAPLADLPEVAPEWRDEIRRLGETEAALEAAETALNAQLKRLDTERESIELDQPILDLEHRISALDSARARYQTARDDLPERHAELARLNGQIDQLRNRLGAGANPSTDTGSDATHLLLDATTTACLRELIETRSELDIYQATARKEAEDAKAAFEDASARLPETEAVAPLGDEPDQAQQRLASLTNLVEELRNQDHGLRRQSARRAVELAQEKLASRLEALKPWQGDATELAIMMPPSRNQIHGWKSEGEDLARKRAANEEDYARQSALLNRLITETDAITQTRNLLPDEDIARLKSARDQAWATHKTSLSAETASQFETLLRSHDEATATRSSHFSAIAKLNENKVQIELIKAELEELAKTEARLKARRDALDAQIAKALSALSPSLPQDLTPETLETWLDRRDLALDAKAELENHQRDLKNAEHDRQAATERLSKSVAALTGKSGDTRDFETLMAEAQQLILHQTKRTTDRQQAQELNRTYQARKKQMAKAEDDLQAWQLAWKQACTGSWLAERERLPTVAEVREILPLLADLIIQLDKRAGLADRITKMERDQASYISTLTEIAGLAGMETADKAPPAIAQDLANRLAAATRAQSRRDDLTARIEQAQQDQHIQAEKRAAHENSKQRMLRALGAESLNEAALRIDKALERKQLAESTSSLREQIRQSLNLPSFEDARARLEAADQTALTAEKEELDATLETLDTEVQECFAERRAAQNELDKIGGDDAVARIEQRRRTTLEAIADGATRYLKLSAGVLAMEQALALYREQHRSSMMARASDAIATISRGHYTGLSAQPDKDRELLLALTREGSSKQATEMSKGARFQLYLALRVAGYHEFAQSRQTVPFIADDIMETFDDFRAEETFKLFAQMAGVGQVIYLTHHRHLCDIARSVCPSVKIHEIGS